MSSIRRVLEQSIISIFTFISHKLYASNHLLMFKATRCLIAVFDGSSIDDISTFNNLIDPISLFHFAFLHFKVS